MSLTTALNAGVTAMTTAQYNTAIASANIANADTDGYTVKSTSNRTQVVQGQAVGVTGSAATSAIDSKLLESIYASNAELGYAETLNNYYTLLESQLGSVSADNTISELLSDFETTLTELSSAPNDTSLQMAAVDALEAATHKLNAQSEAIQNLRAAVDQVNDLLAQLDQLNAKITAGTANGASTADLEDQRNTALTELSQYMDITSFTNSDNHLNIYTSGGTALLTASPRSLSYDATSNVTSSVSYPGGFDDITVNGHPITDEISGGSLGSLLDLRDSSLSSLQESLDALADNLIEGLNTISNTGTAYPAPNSLEGTQTVAGPDALSGTGSFRVATVDANGTVQTAAQVDLSTVTTVQDLADAIDVTTGISATVNTDGHLQICAVAPSQGIAVNEMDSDIGGMGFSNYFGLNDLLTGDGAGNIALAEPITADASRLLTGRLSGAASLTAGDIGITSGDSSTIQSMAAQLNGDTNFSATGLLGNRTTSYTAYAADISSATATRIANAGENFDHKQSVNANLVENLANQTGVNVDEEVVKLNTYQQSYEAGASVISTVQEMFDVLMDMVR